MIARRRPAPSSWPPPLLLALQDPQRGAGTERQGAARDPERKGPSLGPNAGGVSLDRRRLGTTAGAGDKVTYQSRFGARADTLALQETRSYLKDAIDYFIFPGGKLLAERQKMLPT